MWPLWALSLASFTLWAGDSDPGAVKKGSGKHHKEVETTDGPVLFWSEPADIKTRNLFFGPGGEKHQPRGPFKFIEEDLDGTNPKFVVRDGDGVKWKVKLGLEARSETAASRLVWSVGYFTNEDYFLPDLQVDGMPAHLHRGQDQAGPGGYVHNVRLKRDLKGQKKIGTWSWIDDPLTGRREWHGLRVMMALINNWDLKDENNAIYRGKDPNLGPVRVYMVSDLGASFGTPRLTLPLKKTRDDLKTYRDSEFIKEATPLFINFSSPGRASAVFLFRPHEYKLREDLEWIGKNIPRPDAKWMGQVLARLSTPQIRDAFWAAGYTREEVEGFAEVVEARIAELNRL
jgi:hypothetical protein